MRRHVTHRAAGAGHSAGAPVAETDDSAPSRFVPVAPASTLTVGHAEDPAEHAADRMAESALSRIQRAPEVGSAPSAAGATQSVIGREGGALDASTDNAIQRMRGGGTPLAGEVRSRMESAFGADLGAVRVHADNRAADLSGRLSARAFTVGSDVFFGSGQFRPETASGEHTLAHELAHVVQGGGSARRIHRLYDMTANTPLGVATTTEMTTVGNRQVWFLDDGTTKIVVKLEDQPFGLNQLATQLHAKLTPTSTVTTKKLSNADRTAVRQMISDARVTGGNGWSQAVSGDISKDQFAGDDNAWGRAVHLHKIDNSTDPMIAMTMAAGKTATNMADPALSYEQDGMAPIKKVLTEPKMLRQLGELTATDLFTGNADRVLSGNLGNWFYTPDREMTVIDNVDGKMTGHLNAVGAKTGGTSGPDVAEGDRDPLWKLGKGQLQKTAEDMLKAISNSVSGTYLKQITLKSGSSYEVADKEKKKAWTDWLEPHKAAIVAEFVVGLQIGRKRIINTMTSTKFSNRGKRAVKKEIKAQARAAATIDNQDRGAAPDYYEILKARAVWLSSH